MWNRKPFGVRAKTRGFTLMEVIVTVILLGLALAAVLAGIGLGVQFSGEGSDLTRAVFLAQEIREMTTRLSFSEVAALDGASYSPPVSAHGETLLGSGDWSQSVNVTWRSDSDPGQTVSAGTSDILFVRVQVFRQGELVLTTGWLVARKE
jgi:prepilin-type N-terminal cleavage/methylation domain-containing protein